MDRGAQRPGSISLLLLVKNEEKNLARCLDSARVLADEIVVVDTGSTDSTVDIARRYEARVIFYDFTRVDFAAARNHGLGFAAGDWILTLDADEVLDAVSVPLVREFVRRSLNAAYYFQRVNYRSDLPNPTVDHVIRLFPNRGEFRYRGRVHETVDASILAAGARLVPTNVRIHHQFTSSPDARRERNHWYIRILEEEITADPADTSRLDFLAAEYHQMGMYEKAAQITERVTELRPLDADARLRAGVYHLAFQADRARARMDFVEALRLRPGHPQASALLHLLDQQEARA